MRACHFAPVVFAAATVLAACGGSPTAPSGAGVSVDGTLLGLSVAASSLHASAGSTAAASEVTVTCMENPAIVTTVGPDGRFTLRGLPEGGFTLAFKQGTGELGSASFSEVMPNQQITVTVAVTTTGVTVVEEKRNGIGHGDLEIEGLVQQVLCGVPPGASCTAPDESRFLIDGYTVVARPDQTTIREGNTARTVADVTVGSRVHVKGTWLPVEGTTQPVLALEILLQNDGTSDGAFTCLAASKAEVEGLITAKAATSITVSQQGKGLYECQVPSGVPIRKGNKTYTFAQLATGWRVHVTGTTEGFMATAGGNVCQVTASEVKVQNN
jgi:hypothetical protein